MTEPTLEIQSNGQYKNIIVQTKYEWNKTKKEFIFGPDGKKKVKAQGLKPGESIVVEKRFAEGRPFGEFGGINAGVIYAGEDVSFPLDAKYAEAWNNCGGVGDRIRVSCVTENRFNKKVGVEVPTEVLKFEKVN
jgi:hypothetical protein